MPNDSVVFRRWLICDRLDESHLDSLLDAKSKDSVESSKYVPQVAGSIPAVSKTVVDTKTVVNDTGLQHHNESFPAELAITPINIPQVPNPQSSQLAITPKNIPQVPNPQSSHVVAKSIKFV